MAYQSLYRRYRPQRFSEVRGQEHLVRALRNAVRDDKVGQAYLLSGPRGTGKTSTARILAKVLNCENPVDGEPCCACASCLAVEQGTSFDVHELDAASNNGVDAVRDLIAKAALGTPGRTKVYILDEVHMLSTAASNALLKTLEEPPDHVVFVLATTDPQKVLPTIRSRCQHVEVRLLPAADLEALVDHVVADAGLDITPEARAHVLRQGAGSARDTLSALDQVVAAGGIPAGGGALDDLVEAVCDRDTGRALVAVEQAVASGLSPRVLGETLIARLRDVFLAAVGGDLARLPEPDRARASDQARRLSAAGATRALETLGDAFVGIQDMPDQRIPLEVALVRITRPDSELSLSALADRLARLERGQPATSAPTAAPAPASDRPAAASDPESPTPSVSPEAAPAEVPTSPDASVGADGRPADVARQALARTRGRQGTGPSRSSRPPSPAPAAASAPAPPPATQPTAPPAADPAPAVPSAAPPDGAFPDRDALTLAWGDTVFPSLPNRARARFGAGRFVEVSGGTAVFGLPNKIHAAKCEDVRADVEAALAAHFGHPVPLRIVVDDDPAPPPGRGPVDPDPAPGSEPEPDEVIDLHDLTDATDVAGTSVDRVTQVFPGAELIDEEQP